MTWLRVAFLVLTAVWAMAPPRAVAQPIQLYDCVDDGAIGDACSDISVGDYFSFLCPRMFYESFRGRLAWPPLRYVGPITLEVQTHATPGTRFPLYFEFLALTGRDPTLGYCDGPGRLLAAVPGREDCGSDIYGPLDLGRFGVGMNEPYVVRAHFVGDNRGFYESPFFRCVRVQPVASAVLSTDWGRAKMLYK